MDVLDRILPKPIRTEQFILYSSRRPEQLIRKVNAVFISTHGFTFTPNITGEFTSGSTFRARPKWSLLIINRGMTGPAVRMAGEIRAYGRGSMVSIELQVHWALGVLALFPIILMLIWLMMVPTHHFDGLSMKEAFVPILLGLFLPSFALISAWIAKMLFKRNFIRCFELYEGRDPADTMAHDEVTAQDRSG